MLPTMPKPKVAEFFLAFVLLGCIFNFNGMLWCHLLAVSAAFASQRIQASQRLVLWLNRTIGAVFVALGLKLALSR